MSLLALPAPCLASNATPYLTWSGKTPPPAPQQTYTVPPSPYGQVGDPYRQTLDWPARHAQTPQQAAPQQASIQPLPQQPLAAPPPPVSVAVPRPMPQPAPIVVPPPPASDPEDEASAVPQSQATPAPAPLSTPPASAAYQVPSTSKYAARIAAARAAQQAGQQPQDAASPAGGAAPAAPTPDTSLASQETDHVFIPGEQITDAVSQEPRRYSLHRQYGLQPDRIQVDHSATGALLETPLDSQLSGEDVPAADSDSNSAKDGGPSANP